MNSKLYKVLAVVGVLLVTACDRKLDISPTQELENEFFVDQQRMQAGVTAVYAKITDLYGYNANNPRHKIWLLPGDDLRANNPRPMDTFKGLTGADSDVNFVWSRLYQLVSRANTMLQKIEENPQVYTEEATKKYNTGEMLFLRSWAFFKLWSWWGKAPVITDRIVGLENVYKGPSEGMEMLNQAIADLEKAASLLPESWPAPQAGRVTRNAANGMLVKCYVTRANFSGNNTDDHKKAIAAFEKISSATQLVDHFGKNFDYRFENNQESLFEFQASLKTAENPWLDNDFTDAVGTMGAYYKHFLDDFTNQGTLVAPTQKLVEAFDPADPRVAETFEKTGAAAWTFNGGYKMLKYVKDERNKFAGIANINSINNTRILRYADVKLLAAEAYLQTGQLAQALKQVNDIRQRARSSTSDGTRAAQPADLAAVSMQDIMNERFRELAGEEGHRWNDLRRWHKAGFIDLASWEKTKFGFPNNYSGDLFGFNAATNMLMPIPTSELDNNPEMLKSGQNPGY
ncbi:RagB/SusD family nutrient uptake outer membrane protein [Persicitalea jodogahamensis]|uniref:Membrane protein n=1 Tax=Persicitalea jodogahamensis TaxID=402147 RepID=A0A8J3DBR2_9BACT|nr:RagB/SusD family nutrient uptake outer membrane protein [Persicitalea jodogahamensis]GHB86550.1 membrane protein [Persicitalea jodogahamensis]